MSSRGHRWLSVLRTASLAGLMLVLGACATWQAPTDSGDASLRARAVSQEKNGVSLSAAVLGPEDSLRMLGTDVTRSGVQPVWIEVRNDTDEFLWLLRAGTDPDYFSPLEVAWSVHVTMGGKTNDRIDEHFDRMAFPNPVPARSTSSGVLFTNPQPVTKVLNVDLLGDRKLVPFTLLLPVPGDVEGGREVTYRYGEGEIVDYSDLDELRSALEAMPCCAATADGREAGEPLNVVLIGRLDDIAAAAGRRGYRRSLEASVSGQTLFGRPPDFVSRKLAQAGAPSNWVRFWRAPISYRGEIVFLGQAGRPIGGRFARESAGSRQLHPNVDEARNLLIQDFMYSGGLDKLAFVSGVGKVPETQHRVSGGRSYFTDGRRAVLFLSTRPLAFSDVEVLDWEPVLQEAAVEAEQEARGEKN
jgi:hypothetical protein